MPGRCVQAFGFIPILSGIYYSIERGGISLANIDARLLRLDGGIIKTMHGQWRVWRIIFFIQSVFEDGVFSKRTRDGVDMAPRVANVSFNVTET